MMTSKHPANTWLAARQAIALLSAPLAWIVQICVCESLAAQSCFPGHSPAARPAVGAVMAYIGAVSLVCFVVAAGGLTVAWSGWRITSSQSDSTIADPDRRASRFIFLVGIISSPIFVLGLILTAVAALIVSPCKPW